MPNEQDVAKTYPIRVTGIFATRWQHRKHTSGGQPGFDLGRLKGFYELYQDQMPQALDHQQIPLDELAFASPGRPTERMAEIANAESWLFALPSGQVVAALAFDFHSTALSLDPTLTVRILELCARAQIEIRGVELANYIRQLALATGAEITDQTPEHTVTLPPEHYEVVFARELPGNRLPSEELIKHILYRIDPPYREEFMPLARPSALNREARTFCAVTPYVSVLLGHQEDVHSSVMLTTVQAVGTAARFREIWHEAHQQVQNFRETGQAHVVGQQRRADLEELVDELGNLELDLSFSVETPADLGLLIPSLRIESFHRELYRVMELGTRAKTVSQMFERLDSSIKSELRAIEIRERREEEQKRLRGAIAVSALSLIGVPLGFIVAFFGINAVQVDSNRSMFDMSHYLGVYVVAALLGLIPVIVFLILHGKA